MPAESQAQQKLMAMALAYKRGKMPHASKKIKEVAKGMSEKQLHDFAKTKREGLPEKKAMESEERKKELFQKALDYKQGKMPFATGRIRALAKSMSESQLHDSLKKEKKAFEIGFVKRAMEYGYTEEQGAELYKQAVTKAEMYDMQASPAMNALTASNIGLPYNALKDMTSPHDVPSRLLNISLPSIAGAIGGSALSAGLSNLGDAGLGSTLMHTALGGAGGALLGGYLGAKGYNEKIRDLLEDEQRVWENDAGRLRLSTRLI